MHSSNVLKTAICYQISFHSRYKFLKVSGMSSKFQKQKQNQTKKSSTSEENTSESQYFLLQKIADVFQMAYFNMYVFNTFISYCQFQYVIALDFKYLQ